MDTCTRYVQVDKPRAWCGAPATRWFKRTEPNAPSLIARCQAHSMEYGYPAFESLTRDEAEVFAVMRA